MSSSLPNPSTLAHGLNHRTTMDFDEKLSRVPDKWANGRVHFFKYMPVSVARIVLTSRTLRWSTPGTLNDPYDVQFDLRVQADPVLLKAMALDKMWAVLRGERDRPIVNMSGQGMRLLGMSGYSPTRTEFDSIFGPGVDEGLHRLLNTMPEANSDVRRMMASSKLLCLTEDPTNPSMWAHYADQNRGVVLCFRSIPAFDSPYGMARRVEYLRSLPNLLDEEFLSDLLAGYRNIEPKAIIDRLVFTKGEAWSNEKEWRVYSGDGRNAFAPHEDLPFHDLEIDHAIFGINTSAEDQKTISSLCQRYPNIELLRAVRSETGFAHKIARALDA